MQKSMKKYFWLFALPTLIAFAIAFLVPFIMGIYLSFNLIIISVLILFFLKVSSKNSPKKSVSVKFFTLFLF